MARIFTTSFEFNDQMHDAIVTVILQDGQLNFHVRLLNSDMQYLLPEGDIVYKGQNGFEQLATIDNTTTRSFLRSMGMAIGKHLSTA